MKNSLTLFIILGMIVSATPVLADNHVEAVPIRAGLETDTSVEIDEVMEVEIESEEDVMVDGDVMELPNEVTGTNDVAAQSGMRGDDPVMMEVTSHNDAMMDDDSDDDDRGNMVSTTARLRAQRGDVDGMTEESRQEFLANVKSWSEVQSDQELDNFAKGVLIEADSVESVESSDNEVKVQQRVEAKFLGIFKSSLRQTTSVSFADAEANRVEVKKPWYGFLFSTAAKKDQVQAAVQAQVDAFVAEELEAGVEGNPNVQAGFIHALVNALQRFAGNAEVDSDVAAEAEL
jgi:hypothetical protein